MRNMVRIFRSALLLTTLVTLAACSSLQTVSTPDAEQRAARTDRLQQLSDWTLDGRIAVKHQAGGGQGNLLWSQSDDTADIRLSGPLGVGASRILWMPDEVVFERAGERLTERYTGPAAAETFVRDQLGWQLPVSSIRFWVLGVPDPAFSYNEETAADGTLLVLQQRGWKMSYSAFAAVEDEVLPQKLVVENDAVRLRLVADSWELSSP